MFITQYTSLRTVVIVLCSTSSNLERPLAYLLVVLAVTITTILCLPIRPYSTGWNTTSVPLTWLSEDARCRKGTAVLLESRSSQHSPTNPSLKPNEKCSNLETWWYWLSCPFGAFSCCSTLNSSLVAPITPSEPHQRDVYCPGHEATIRPFVFGYFSTQQSGRLSYGMMSKTMLMLSLQTDWDASLTVSSRILYVDSGTGSAAPSG
jgi:hypothetical protein